MNVSPRNYYKYFHWKVEERGESAREEEKA